MTKDELTLNASKIGTWGGSSAGFMTWLANNSDAVTAIVAIISVVIALASFGLRFYLELKEDARKQIVFEQVQEERRLLLKKDTGQRRRKND